MKGEDIEVKVSFGVYSQRMGEGEYYEVMRFMTNK